MSLKDQIAADTLDVFFVEDDFAEQATYFPKAGGQFAVLIVSAASPRREDIESHHELQVDQVQFSIPALLNAASGLRLDPQRGDSLKLASDPPNVIYEFLEIIDSDADVFNLKFQRKSMQRAGQAVPPRL